MAIPLHSCTWERWPLSGSCPGNSQPLYCTWNKRPRYGKEPAAWNAKQNGHH